MNKELEAIIKLQNLPEGDAEATHHDAENIVTEFLRDNGNELLADNFDEARVRLGWWYA